MPKEGSELATQQTISTEYRRQQRRSLLNPENLRSARKAAPVGAATVSDHQRSGTLDQSPQQFVLNGPGPENAGRPHFLPVQLAKGFEGRQTGKLRQFGEKFAASRSEEHTSELQSR